MQTNSSTSSLILTIKRYQKSIYFLFLGIYIILAVDALFHGISTWDELGDFNGTAAQISHALKLLTLQPTDYQTSIPYNLEYYGISSTVVPYLFSRLANSGFSTYLFISHLILPFWLIGMSACTYLISSRLRLGLPWLAAAFVFLIPSLVGHSFTNTKDLPFASLYTLYTYSLITRYQSGNTKVNCGFAVLSSGLLINLKAIFALPVVMLELLLALAVLHKKHLNGRLPSTTDLFSGVSLGLLLSLVSVLFSLCIQPSAWGLPPWQYFHETFQTFSTHVWSGCMRWDGSCIDHHDPKWSTFKYVYKWVSIKLPLFVLILLGFGISLLCSRPRQLRRNANTNLLDYTPLLLQLVLLPLLAILGDSNLYGADRHLLFIYPPLCVFAAKALESLLLRQSYASKSLILAVFISILLVLADTALIHPYQIAYFNELARVPSLKISSRLPHLSLKRHDHLTTSTDFWGASTKELAQLYKSSKLIQRSPLSSVEDSTHNPPFLTAFQEVGGQISHNSDHRLVLLNGDHPGWWTDYGSCTQSWSVSRRPLFSKPIIMSKLYECPTSFKR